MRRPPASTLLLLFFLSLFTSALAADTLKYLGELTARSDGRIPDEHLGVSIHSNGFLLVSGSTGLDIVSRSDIDQGTVSETNGHYSIPQNVPSNLDGIGDDLVHGPKFYNTVVSGSYAYIAARYDGLWIIELQRSGRDWSLLHANTLLREREFTEDVAVHDNTLFLAHHRDGIEVLDLSSSRTEPISVARMADPLVDARGVSTVNGNDLWVADGAGGAKLLRYDAGTLTLVAGDTLETSPGVVFDVLPFGEFALAAVGGQGLSLYDAQTLTRVDDLLVGGVCVDLDVVSATRAAVACRGWIHVVEISAQGELSVVASKRLQRRPDGFNDLGVHLGQQVAVDGDRIYVAGWDSTDALQLVADDPDDVPHIEISGQRAQFNRRPASIEFTVSNAGEGLLQISEIDCVVQAITCTLGTNALNAGEQTTLTVQYDGSAANLDARIDLISNDPDDATLGVLVFADLDGIVDPGERAPDFSSATLLHDYATDTPETSTLTLSQFRFDREVVHFAIFGSWCPACGEAIASMIGDVQARMPEGSTFFMINQNEPQELVAHLLEKIYLPVTIVLDTEGEIGGGLYSQPKVGLPFSRSYIVDETGRTTHVFTDYAPGSIIDAVEDTLP